jgi:guanylate kinase
MPGKLIIISAPSGAGKTTIVKHILGLDLNLKFSVSACSRKPRINEADGKDYYFISPELFRNKIENQEFVEWEEVYEGCFYGTLKSEVERIWQLGNHVIFDVDVKGGINIKRQFPENSLALFIRPPSVAELEKRLRNRSTDTEEVIQTRVKKAEYELSFAPEFDRIIVNEVLEVALHETEMTIRNFLNS